MANPVATKSITDTLVNIEPSGVVFNITNDIVEEFVENYLTKKGVTGIASVRMQVRNEGRTNPNVALYLFLNQNSSSFESNSHAVPELLKGKIDKVQVNLKDEFKQTLYPICGSNIESGKADGREYYVKLNIFRVVGLMLAADPDKHTLVISDAKILPNNASIISVLKGTSYYYNNGKTVDKYSRQIDYFEKRK